jgi:hypothetical protein
MGQRALQETTGAGKSFSFNRALDLFAGFPYQSDPFCRRNWGHPLHSLCSYPSKLKPGLAHFLVTAFTMPGDVVLDPFCGVGTLPFEASMQGRVGVGSDLSPLASLVTSAKLAPPAPDDLDAALNELDAEITASSASLDLSEVEPEIREFFHDDTCREILAARRHLFDPARADTPPGKLIASAVCHILHGNRPYALSRRSHGIIPIPPRGEFTYKSLMVSLRAKIARLRIAELPEDFTPGLGLQGDAGEIDFESHSIDAIITSPPFLGTTEFLRQNRVRLWFCGMDYSQQRSSRDQFVEYRRDLSFYSDILFEWARVLRPQGRLIMHLGVVRNRDMAEEIRPCVEEAGFTVHDILYEPATHLESHGRTDRGATHTHQFLIAERL